MTKNLEQHTFSEQPHQITTKKHKKIPTKSSPSIPPRVGPPLHLTNHNPPNTTCTGGTIFLKRFRQRDAVVERVRTCWPHPTTTNRVPQDSLVSYLSPTANRSTHPTDGTLLPVRSDPNRIGLRAINPPPFPLLQTQQPPFSAI